MCQEIDFEIKGYYIEYGMQSWIHPGQIREENWIEHD